MPPKVCFVTRNPGKVVSVSSGLESYGIQVTHFSANLEELQNDSTEVIAAQKARDGFRLTGAPTVALDAGFCLPSLGNFPGPYVEYVLRKLGVEQIIQLAWQSQRVDCFFVESFAFYDGSGNPVVFSEQVPGRLAPKPQGVLSPRDWSPLSLAFIPQGLEVTLSQMSEEQAYQWRQERQNAGTYFTKMGEFLTLHHLAGLP
jgi:non-canonical purine NTP pyrophosphatase (RdgB/HAM1 family)